jgi:Ca2+-binding RTX toxin-like protein
MATYNGTSVRNVWYGTSSADTARGNGGDDSLYGRDGNDTLYGDAGNDGLYGENGNDLIYGGAGVDALFGAAGSDTLRGEDGDDYLEGGSGDDGLYGGSGIDRLRGGDGIDALFGDANDDDLDGGSGDDYLVGGLGNDQIVGGTGHDRLRGGDGNDYLSGGSGNNNVMGDAGNDTLVFTARATDPLPNDTGLLDGGAGYDTLLIDVQGNGFDQDGASTVYLHMGTATQRGTIGVVADHVEPSGLWFGDLASIEEVRVVPSGNAMALSASTNMKVTGSSHTDYLEGGTGDQVFDGGGGADRFQFLHRVGYFSGHDTVKGFSKAQGDRIQFNNEDYGSGPDWDLSARHVTNKVEQNGHTIYTTSDSQTGQVMHVLDVDAVGLPPPDYYLLG